MTSFPGAPYPFAPRPFPRPQPSHQQPQQQQQQQQQQQYHHGPVPIPPSLHPVPQPATTWAQPQWQPPAAPSLPPVLPQQQQTHLYPPISHEFPRQEKQELVLSSHSPLHASHQVHRSSQQQPAHHPRDPRLFSQNQHQSQMPSLQHQEQPPLHSTSSEHRQHYRPPPPSSHSPQLPAFRYASKEAFRPAGGPKKRKGSPGYLKPSKYAITSSHSPLSLQRPQSPASPVPLHHSQQQYHYTSSSDASLHASLTKSKKKKKKMNEAFNGWNSSTADNRLSLHSSSSVQIHPSSASRHVKKESKKFDETSFYDHTMEDDHPLNPRVLARLKSLEDLMHDHAAAKDDNAAVFGLSAAVKHELYTLQESASLTVFEAMLWILCRSGFVYRSTALITHLYQETFRPKGSQDEVEQLLMSPLFRPFLKATIRTGKMYFRLDPIRIRATLSSSYLGDSSVDFPPTISGLLDIGSSKDEMNPIHWKHTITPIIKLAMISKADKRLQLAFPFTSMLLPSQVDFKGTSLEGLDKRVPYWDALMIVLDLVDVMPAGSWERSHALVEIYVSVARAIVSSKDFDKILKDYEDDEEIQRRLMVVRAKSTYHKQFLPALTSDAKSVVNDAIIEGHAVEPRASIPASISVYDDIEMEGSDVSEVSDIDDSDDNGNVPPMQASTASTLVSATSVKTEAFRSEPIAAALGEGGRISAADPSQEANAAKEKPNDGRGETSRVNKQDRSASFSSSSNRNRSKSTDRQGHRSESKGRERGRDRERDRDRYRDPYIEERYQYDQYHDRYDRYRDSYDRDRERDRYRDRARDRDREWDSRDVYGSSRYSYAGQSRSQSPRRYHGEYDDNRRRRSPVSRSTLYHSHSSSTSSSPFQRPVLATEPRVPSTQEAAEAKTATASTSHSRAPLRSSSSSASSSPASSVSHSATLRDRAGVQSPQTAAVAPSSSHGTPKPVQNHAATEPKTTTTTTTTTTATMTHPPTAKAPPILKSTTSNGINNNGNATTAANSPGVSNNSNDRASERSKIKTDVSSFKAAPPSSPSTLKIAPFKINSIKDQPRQQTAKKSAGPAKPSQHVSASPSSLTKNGEQPKTSGDDQARSSPTAGAAALNKGESNGVPASDSCVGIDNAGKRWDVREKGTEAASSAPSLLLPSSSVGATATVAGNTEVPASLPSSSTISRDTVVAIGSHCLPPTPAHKPTVSIEADISFINSGNRAVMEPTAEDLHQSVLATTATATIPISTSSLSPPPPVHAEEGQSNAIHGVAAQAPMVQQVNFMQGLSTGDPLMRPPVSMLIDDTSPLMVSGFPIPQYQQQFSHPSLIEGRAAAFSTPQSPLQRTRPVSRSDYFKARREAQKAIEQYVLTLPLNMSDDRDHATDNESAKR